MYLYEKYRPKNLDEFIGQDKIKKQLAHILARPSFDRDVFMFQGPTGTGKTSLAWIIAKQLAHDSGIIELDGEKCTIEEVRQLEIDFLYAPMAGKWKVAIVNEVHSITSKAVQGFLTLLERLPANRLIIFTTTELISEDLFGNFSGPFGSRCKVFTFTNQGLSQPMAQRALEIAQAEGLDGQPFSRYVRLIQDCKNNMRQALQRIDSCEMMA